MEVKSLFYIVPMYLTKYWLASHICLFFFGVCQLQVRFSDDKELTSNDKTLICKDLKSFLAPIQEKMRMFEEELKGR